MKRIFVLLVFCFAACGMRAQSDGELSVGVGTSLYNLTHKDLGVSVESCIHLKRFGVGLGMSYFSKGSNTIISSTPHGATMLRDTRNLALSINAQYQFLSKSSKYHFGKANNP